MKINIKNYRNIIDLNLKINEGKINYLLGANESGKTNLLNAIQLLDRESKLSIQGNDYTKESGKTPSDEHPYIIATDLLGRKNKIDHKNSISFLNIESEARNIYFKLIEENKENKEKLIAKINHEILELPNDEILEEENKATLNTSKEMHKKIIERIFLKLRINNYEWMILQDVYNENWLDKLNKAYKNLSLDRPLTIYVEPILKAKEKQNIKYSYNDLFKEKSTIRNIFSAFIGIEQSKQKLNEIKLTEDVLIKADLEDVLFTDLNNKMTEYFEQFKYIKAIPFFKSTAGEIILLIKSKNNIWKYDSKNENERSLGFKTFLRIIIELKALSVSKQKAWYIIDEPEQSLHPFLQSELIKELKSVINDNLTIILASHSPYIVQIESLESVLDCQYVTRGDDGEVKIQTFENIEEVLESAEKYFNDSNSYEHFFMKIIYDSFGNNNITTMIQKKLKQINREIHSNKNKSQNIKMKHDLFMLKSFLDEK